MADSEVLDLETAYRNYQQRMLAVIAKLARNGYALAPGEAVDVIHDFFIERWEAIRKNYRPDLGDLGAYVYRAFYNFALRRAHTTRLRRAHFVQQPFDMDKLAAPEAIYSTIDLEDVRRLVAGFPSRQRELLFSYLDGVSQRTLAAQHSMSRYQVQEALTDSLGSFVAALGGTQRLASRDLRVAESLWRAKRTVCATAHHLGLTVRDVQRSRLVIFRLLADSLSRSTHHAEGSMTMSEHIRLLKDCLSSPGNTELLSRLRNHAKEIVECLNSETGENEIEAAGLFDLPVANSGWVAQVYDALSGSEPPPLASDTQQLEDQATESAVADFLTTSSPIVREQFDKLVDLGFLKQQHMGTIPLFWVVDYAALEFGLLTETAPSDALAPSFRAVDGLTWNTDLNALLSGGIREVVPDVNAAIVHALCQWLRVASEHEPTLIPGFYSAVDKRRQLMFTPRPDVLGAIHSRRQSFLSQNSSKQARQPVSIS